MEITESECCGQSQTGLEERAPRYKSYKEAEGGLKIGADVAVW